MTYVTDDWELHEVVLDFCEVVGEHSGENLADIVWRTIELYGLQNKVRLYLLKLLILMYRCHNRSRQLSVTMHQIMIQWWNLSY